MQPTRFVGLDVHKERISISVAESGRQGAVEYFGEIDNDPARDGAALLTLRSAGVVGATGRSRDTGRTLGCNRAHEDFEDCLA
jgi:hypothetical protein